jgi:hypothetical protein
MDSTNQGIAQANVTPGGTTARDYAVKRMQRQQRLEGLQRPGRVQQQPVPSTPVRRA